MILENNAMKESIWGLVEDAHKRTECLASLERSKWIITKTEKKEIAEVYD